MRIISKTRDYYDGFMNHNRKDRFNKVWERKYKKIELNVNELRTLEERYFRIHRESWSTGFLIIAGRVIPFAVQTTREYDKPDNYYYDAESAYEAYTNEKKPTHFPGWRWGWVTGTSKSRLVEFFGLYSDYTELNIKCGTPVILVNPSENFYQERDSSIRTIEINVNLKRRGFSKLYDAPTIYQELDLFVSNVLINDDMPASPQTDLEKVHSHGHDKKYGFRTRPKGGKSNG